MPEKIFRATFGHFAKTKKNEFSKTTVGPEQFEIDINLSSRPTKNKIDTIPHLLDHN